MSTHPAISKDNVAVVTGAADGIGFAIADRLARDGMRVCMADFDGEKVEAAAKKVDGAVPFDADVRSFERVCALRDEVFDRFGRVDVLVNNAGTGLPTQAWSELENWKTILDTNLWGVIHGVQAFTEKMVEQRSPGLIINTGSKQGITTPPGSPAYNVSKAGVKATTEALAYQLRNTEDCHVTAHLLVPGFTFTGAIRKWTADKPPGAWDSSQVADFLIESVERGDFYILCPDNDVDRETDNRRMEWAMGDLIHNRPALSRWHPDHAEAFEAFVKGR